MIERVASSDQGFFDAGELSNYDPRAVGLCFSGGGYRATLFHTGTVLRLNGWGFCPRSTGYRGLDRRAGNARKSVGPVYVQVSEVETPATDPSTISSTIGFRRPSLLELLVRNPNRVPANGGHSVVPGKVYKIEVIGTDAQGGEVPAKNLKPEYRFAAKAIVDFEVTL